MSVPVYIERAGDCDEIAAYNLTRVKLHSETGDFGAAEAL
jgi:hypothetical protein